MKNNLIIKILGTAIILLLITAGVVLAVNQRDSDENQIIEGEATSVYSGEPAVVIIEEGGLFNPSTIKIKTGMTVEWQSADDDNNHQIVSGPHPADDSLESLSSPILGVDEKYTYRFNEPGTYYYHDEIHPELNGEIIVE